MKKFAFVIGISLTLCHSNFAFSHCQMPCGIYHDDMVYDQIDQYVETMYKGITVLNQSKFSSIREKNEFVRWVIQKEKASDEAAQIITTYFLQQKIKPGEEDTVKRLTLAHDLLFLIVQIKQNTDIKIVEEFAKKWEEFKLLFHVEGYECRIEQLKMMKREEKQKEAALRNSKSQSRHQPHTHDHDHDHDHDHPHDHDHDH